MATVALGLLGTTLDAARRGRPWRPTVDLVAHDALAVDRLELLYPPSHEALAAAVAADVRSASPPTEVRLHEVAFGDPWDFEQVYAALDDFARRYPFRDDEDYLVHITTGTHVAQICLFLLVETRRIPAKLVQTSPQGPPDVVDLDLSKYDALRRRAEEERAGATDFLKAGIATRDPGFNALMERLEVVATSSTAPILLLGPTGAGKTRLARRLYELKRSRRLVAGGFVEVNCATLRGDQAMSTLFGHVKGSFTGALKDREGLLHAADGGVLFLDEIGELGLDEQAMVLRALEEGRFRPFGADREAKSSFQLLAGTNQDLDVAVRDGRFREDLLHRIDLWTFALPPLAARKRDVEPNVDYELARWEEKTGRRVRFAVDARRAFLSFATGADAAWPGNFRELSATIERMATLARGGLIDRAVVDDEIARRRAAWARDAPADDDDAAVLAGVVDVDAIDPFDRAQLAYVVRVCRASRTLAEAGRALFAVSRTKRRTTNDSDRVRKYLASFGLTFDDVLAPRGGH